MPSGAKVFVHRLKTQTNLEVYVMPLRQDAYRTTGLCGNYNLNPNDYMAESGNTCTTTCEAYRHEILLLLFVYDVYSFSFAALLQPIRSCCNNGSERSH